MHAGGEARVGGAVARPRTEEERETDGGNSAYTEVRVEERPTDEVGTISGRVRTRQGRRRRWRWGQGRLKVEGGLGKWDKVSGTLGVPVFNA
jgi:hypothetical protein